MRSWRECCWNWKCEGKSIECQHRITSPLALRISRESSLRIDGPVRNSPRNVASHPIAGSPRHPLDLPRTLRSLWPTHRVINARAGTEDQFTRRSARWRCCPKVLWPFLTRLIRCFGEVTPVAGRHPRCQMICGSSVEFLVVRQHEIAGLTSFNRVGNAPRVDGNRLERRLTRGALPTRLNDASGQYKVVRPLVSLRS